MSRIETAITPSNQLLTKDERKTVHRKRSLLDRHVAADREHIKQSETEGVQFQ